MNYEESLAWLYEAQLHGIKLGLENTRRLLAALGVRLDGTGAPKFLHVAGTNGKGSVCAMLEACCRAAGFRTALFTSPHLVTFRERLRCDGAMIGEDEVAAGLTEIRALTAEWDHAATFFEIATALALAWFQKMGAQIAVLETGMGGRLDATNVVTPAVSVIAPIDLDHQPWLGDSLVQIAMEKAGIIKAGVPAISAPQADEVATLLAHVALHRGAPLSFVATPLTGVELRLAGSHQRWNAALAVHALELAAIAVPDAAIAQGLRTVEWPGRFQEINGRITLDGAHNPAAAHRLAQTWREVHGDKRATILLGVLRDKDVRGICEALLPIAGRFIAVPVPNPRTSTPAELCRALGEVAPRHECIAIRDLPAAIRFAQSMERRTLITGSLFLVGEALAFFNGEPRVETSAQ